MLKFVVPIVLMLCSMCHAQMIEDEITSVTEEVNRMAGNEYIGEGDIIEVNVTATAEQEELEPDATFTLSVDFLDSNYNIVSSGYTTVLVRSGTDTVISLLHDYELPENWHVYYDVDIKLIKEEETVDSDYAFFFTD